MSADLHDLLQQSYGDMTLSPERHRRVMTAIAHAPVHAAPAPADRVGSRVRGSIRWRRASASIAAAVLALPAGAAVADTSSLPGDPGYGVRRAAEQVWVAVTWGEADVQARQTIAARRLEEAAALEAQFGPDDQVQELRGEAQELLEPIHAVPAATQVSPDDGRPGAGVGRGRPGHAADASLPDGARADDPPNRGARGGGGQAPAPASADLPPIHAREEGPASDTEAAGSRASRPTDPGAAAGGASTAEDAGGAAAGGRGNGRSPAAGAGGQDQGRGNGRADAPGHSTADDRPAASTVPEYDAGVAPSTQPVPGPPATTRLEDRPPASVPAPAERAPQPPPAAPAPPVTGPANPPPAPPGPPPPPPASAGQPGPPPGAGGGGGGGASAAPNGGPQGPAGQPGPPG